MPSQNCMQTYTSACSHFPASSSGLAPMRTTSCVLRRGGTWFLRRLLVSGRWFAPAGHCWSSCYWCCQPASLQQCEATFQGLRTVRIACAYGVAVAKVSVARAPRLRVRRFEALQRRHERWRAWNFRALCHPRSASIALLSLPAVSRTTSPTRFAVSSPDSGARFRATRSHPTSRGSRSTLAPRWPESNGCLHLTRAATSARRRGERPASRPGR